MRIDVELYSEKDRAREFGHVHCLPAWWQLVRLGMLRDESDSPLVPAKTRLISPKVIGRFLQNER